MNKEEIIKIRKKLKLNQTEFGKKLGVSYQTVSNWETGQVRIPATKVSVIEELQDNNVSEQNTAIKETNQTSNEDVTTVRLLPAAAMGGSFNDFVVSVKDTDECEMVVSPVRNVDGALTVLGESMAPEYPNGSRIFVKRINEQAFIEWGKVYVLDTCNGAVIKQVVQSDREGYVRCVSLNPDPIYQPFDVRWEDIYHWFKVVCCLSLK